MVLLVTTTTGVTTVVEALRQRHVLGLRRHSHGCSCLSSRSGARYEHPLDDRDALWPEPRLAACLVAGRPQTLGRARRRCAVDRLVRDLAGSGLGGRLRGRPRPAAHHSVWLPRPRRDRRPAALAV